MKVLSTTSACVSCLKSTYSIIHQKNRKRLVEIFDKLIEGNQTEAKAKKLRTELKSQILGMSQVLKEKPYFMSDEFSLVDCCIAPHSLRLPLIGIDLQRILNQTDLRIYAKSFHKAVFYQQPI